MARPLLVASFFMAFVSSLFAGEGVAFAKNKEEAEVQRLTDDIERLTTRNHWNGVLRKYEEILAAGAPVGVDVHLMAYQAARNVGDISGVARSLENAAAVETDDAALARRVREASTALSEIYQVFGRVMIEVGPKRIPALIRPEMPFPTEQRSAIERAQEVLADKRVYQGLLPAGRYMVDGIFFEVEAGKKELVVAVR